MINDIEFAETVTSLGKYDMDLGDCDLVPYLVYREYMCGLPYTLVFRNAVLELSDLVGKSGDSICIATLDREEFTAVTISETALDEHATGLTKTRLSPDSVSVSIGDILYVASKITDVLQEDSPTPNWVRITLKKMAEAVWLYIDRDIRDVLRAGATVVAGNVNAATTAGVLSYDDVVDAVAHLKLQGHKPPMLLFINYSQEADLVKDTRFTDTARYSKSGVPLEGFNTPERGRFASCIVFATDILMVDDDGIGATTPYALVVAPPKANSAAAVLAWKRQPKSETWRDEQWQRSVFSLSARYGLAVICPDAIKLVSDC